MYDKKQIMSSWINNVFFKNNFLLEKAINNGYFDKYPEEHLFFDNETFSNNLICNFFNKLNVFKNYLNEKEIKELFINKLCSINNRNYDEQKLLDTLSEIEVLSFYLNVKKRFLSNVEYEPKLNKNINSEKNPEIAFTYNDSINIEIEVKCGDFRQQKLNHGDYVIPYRTEDLICKMLRKNKNTHLPKDNRIKKYLNSAMEKFSISTANKNSSSYGFLFINWQDFTFEDISSILYNSETGIFTENSFIEGKPKYEKISGIIIYQRGFREYGNDIQFGDYRRYLKYFLKNPYSKDLPIELINELFIPDKIIDNGNFQLKSFYTI